MPKLFKCRYPFFRFPNPCYDPEEKDNTKQSHYKYKFVYATREELEIIVNYAQAVKDGNTKGKEFKELERSYLERIVSNTIDGVKPVYNLCSSDDTKRVYVRSSPNQEPEST